MSPTEAPGRPQRPVWVQHSRVWHPDTQEVMAKTHHSGRRHSTATPQLLETQPPEGRTGFQKLAQVHSALGSQSLARFFFILQTSLNKEVESLQLHLSSWSSAWPPDDWDLGHIPVLQRRSRRQASSGNGSDSIRVSHSAEHPGDVSPEHWLSGYLPWQPRGCPFPIQRHDSFTVACHFLEGIYHSLNCPMLILEPESKVHMEL